MGAAAAECIRGRPVVRTGGSRAARSAPGPGCVAAAAGGGPPACHRSPPRRDPVPAAGGPADAAAPAAGQ